MIALAESTNPGMSSGGAAGSRDVGTTMTTARNPMATTGTLTRKTDPHQKCSSSHPPAVGPTAMPSPETPAQMPIARPSSSGGNTLVKIDRVDGMMRAAPRPMRPRV